MIIDPIRTLSIELIHILTDISAWPMKTIQVSFPLLDVLNHLGQEFCFTLFFSGLDLWGYWGFLDWFCEAIEPLMLRLRDTFEMGRWQNHQWFLVSLFSSHFSLQFERIGFGGSGKKHLDLSIFPLIFLLWNKPYFPNFSSTFSSQPNTI